MRVEEQVLLSTKTTLRIGGPAALHITVEAKDELPEAYELAHQRGLSAYPLGEGSNILASDGPIQKALVSYAPNSITYEETEQGTLVHADAGASWDALVKDTTERALWGLENLAGIPGTVGAAPVQNIGAYGREIKDTLVSVDAYDPIQKEFVTLSNAECVFGYRDSRFKRNPGLYIGSATFLLSRAANLELGYPDLQARIAAGAMLNTPKQVADEVRAIRAQKFPDLSVHGTAGSFFKNPSITHEHYGQLRATYPDMPGYEHQTGVKVPLAWILDRVLGMRGYTHGTVSLFQKQPLVLVTEQGATANDVNALATIVIDNVKNTTNIFVEREVQSLS